MLDIPPTAAVLEGVKFELQDCALPNLIGDRSFDFFTLVLDESNVLLHLNCFIVLLCLFGSKLQYLF